MMPRITRLLQRQHWAFVLVSLILFSILTASPAFANMVLSEAIVHFEPGKPLRKDIEVENPSSETCMYNLNPR